MSYSTRSICLRFSLLQPVLLFCLAAFAQRKPEVVVDHRFDPVDQLFKQNQKELGNQYVALVWKDGKLIYEKSGSDDFTPKMQAPIVRMADWMTAALVMTFVDEGKISLDDKVTKYVPMFGKYMKGYITIRNCLTNTTGMRVANEGLQELKKAFVTVNFQSLEDVVNDYAEKRPIQTNPSTEFLYSNLGPNVAARCLEVVAKKPFERLMMERIIRPLKMRATTFESQDGGATNPSGGAYSAGNDYISFLVMLMNKGVAPDGKRILSEKSVQELETPQFTTLPVKFLPKELQGAQTGLGCYITGSGNSTVLLCPDTFGSAAWIDKCRNYAAVLITAKPEEEKKPLFSSMMNLVNEALGGNCN